MLGPKDTWTLNLTGDETKARVFASYAMQQASILKTQAGLAMLGELKSTQRFLQLDKFGSFIRVVKTWNYYAMEIFIASVTVLPVIEDALILPEKEEVILSYAIQNYRDNSGTESFDSGRNYDYATNNAVAGWSNIFSQSAFPLSAYMIKSDTGDVYSMSDIGSMTFYKNGVVITSTSFASWTGFISRTYAPQLIRWFATAISDTHFYMVIREYEPGFIVKHSWLCKMALDGTKVGVIHLGNEWHPACGGDGTRCFAASSAASGNSQLRIYNETTFGNATNLITPTPIRAVTHSNVRNWEAGVFRGDDFYYVAADSSTGFLLPLVGIYDIVGNSFNDLWIPTASGEAMSSFGGGLYQSIALSDSDFLFTYKRSGSSGIIHIGRCFNDEGTWTFDSRQALQDDGLPGTFRLASVKLLQEPEV